MRRKECPLKDHPQFINAFWNEATGGWIWIRHSVAEVMGCKYALRCDKHRYGHYARSMSQTLRFAKEPHRWCIKCMYARHDSPVEQKQFDFEGLERRVFRWSLQQADQFLRQYHADYNVDRYSLFASIYGARPEGADESSRLRA